MSYYHLLNVDAVICYYENYDFFHFTVTETNFLYHSFAIDLLIIHTYCTYAFIYYMHDYMNLTISD